MPKLNLGEEGQLAFEDVEAVYDEFLAHTGDKLAAATLTNAWATRHAIPSTMITFFENTDALLRKHI